MHIYTSKLSNGSHFLMQHCRKFHGSTAKTLITPAKILQLTGSFTILCNSCRVINFAHDDTSTLRNKPRRADWYQNSHTTLGHSELLDCYRHA